MSPDAAADQTSSEWVCNARLRRRSSGGVSLVVTRGESDLRRFGWIGGRLRVAAGEIVFDGSERFVNGNGPGYGAGTGVSIKYGVTLAASDVESVAVRRGLSGAAYVSVIATDGSELQLRVGAFGKDSDAVVGAIRAEMG